MTIKTLLGLEDAAISDIEIMSKVVNAQRSGLVEIEFVKPDGKCVKVFLPKM